MENDINAADNPEVVLVDRRAKVWLECDGEPRDFRSVKVIGVRTTADNGELVVFICPRCGKRHQSLRFV